MLLYTAALRHRAAVAAGGGADGRAPASWQQLRDVVFPHIRGHILTNTLLITLWTFNDFSPYLLTAGGPNGESEILPVYIYKGRINGGQLGYGSAISLLLLLDQPRSSRCHVPPAAADPRERGGMTLVAQRAGAPAAVLRLVAWRTVASAVVLRPRWSSSPCRCCGSCSTPFDARRRRTGRRCRSSPSTTSTTSSTNPYALAVAAATRSTCRSAPRCWSSPSRPWRPTRSAGCASRAATQLLYALLLLSLDRHRHGRDGADLPA